jgi:NADH-quinone oxidoreductase subunit C
MSLPTPDTLAAVSRAAPSATTTEFRGQTRVVVPKESLAEVFTALKARGFDLLADVTCVDYLAYRDATDRFGLVYILVNMTTNERLTLRTFVNEPNPTVVSATGWWEGANWLEREVYDMFGITFDGHPDHRRILCPDEFTAFPLRKDYPLQGRGERHNFERLQRDQA